MGLHTANPMLSALSSSAIPPAGIARRAGRSPSAARKLPEQKPRSPRGMSETGKPKRGASGGMQGGPRRGRSPITGPALPSPEAAQTIIMRKPPCPQGTKITWRIQLASATPSRLNEKARWYSPLASPSNQRLRGVWAMHTLPGKNGTTSARQ